MFHLKSRLAKWLKERPDRHKTAIRLMDLFGLRWEHWSRVVLNRTLADHMRNLGPANLDVLEISGTHWADFGFRSYASVDYPQYDICKSALAESRYDVVIAEQVFEHIRSPWKAAGNVLTMLRPGGRLFISTPFLYRFHPAPEDNWRWTESGMRYFLSDVGFDDQGLITGSWGNLSCVKANLEAIPHWNRYLHSLENDPQYPIMIWAIARKSVV
jgi:SAM-dependent methyltransferase